MILRSFYTPLIYVAKRVKKTTKPIKTEKTKHVIVAILHDNGFRPLVARFLALIAEYCAAFFMQPFH